MIFLTKHIATNQDADLAIVCSACELPNCRIAELPNCRIAELPNCRIAELPNCRIAELLHFIVCQYTSLSAKTNGFIAEF
jgi:hypothetical protein